MTRLHTTRTDTTRPHTTRPGHDTTAHDTTGHDTPGHRTRRDATQPDTTTVRIHFSYRTPLTDAELEWVRLLNPAQPNPEFFDPTQPREIIT